jgi:FkbM family methyltransferase
MPSLEPSFVRLGRYARPRSYLLSTLYFEAHQDLVMRLRRSGRIYRAIQIGRRTFQLDITDHSAIHEFFYGTAFRYEPLLTEHLLKRLTRGHLFVDVGANIGYFSIIAARLGARTIAFEPHPGPRRAMQQLAEKNAVEIEIIGSAVGMQAEHSGILHLATDSVLSTLDVTVAHERHTFTYDRTIAVPITSLDATLLARPELLSLQMLIKIDVEGYEDRVVEGMVGLLEAVPSVEVVCETSPDTKADRQLRDMGLTRTPLDLRTSDFGNFLYRRAVPSTRS